MSTYCNPLFTDVQRPQKEDRWGSFIASYIVQATIVTALVFFTVTAPIKMSTQTEHVELVAPDLSNAPKSEPVQTIKLHSTPTLTAAPVRVTEAPTKIAPPVLQVQQPQRLHRAVEVAKVAQPQIAIAPPKIDPKTLNVPTKAASRIVATNTFGSASPTQQNAAPAKVHTGGFGDPNGASVSNHGSNRSAIAAAGSFDLPTAAGATAPRGTVASAGFANNVAVQHGSSNQGRIQSTSFASTAVATDEHRAKAVSHQALSAPVSIQSKPTPVYTAEARQLRVEGEVLLNVVFTAEGHVRILNVVRGLGHGLDEAAQHAAQGVRFSPAMRDGHPVDSNVTLHIVFQLS
jgi:TonB family protein